jgi:hypothetical protein
MGDDRNDGDDADRAHGREVDHGAARVPVRDAGQDTERDDERDAPRDTGRDVAAPFDAGGDLADLVADAKRRHGLGGAMLAAGMLGLDQAVLGRKPREEIPVVVDANSDPVDIDADGISVALGDDTQVVAPPLPRTPPKLSRRPKRR